MPLSAVLLVSSTNMVGNIQPIASVRPAASRLAPTAWADSAPNAAMLAATISPTADVLSVPHSTASIFRLAVARCVVFMAKGRHGSERETKGRLAITLKIAIKTLQGNICKLERTGASPLLIATRKKRLVRIQEELAKMGPT